MPQQKSMLKNAFFSFSKAFISMIFPIITFPYASRILLPEGIGRVNFSNSIINYFFIISSLGIGGYATREAAKLRNDKLALSKFFKEILTINMISSALSYILFVISLILIPKFGDYKNLLIVSSVRIILTTIGIDWFYTAIEDYKYITVRSFIFQIFALIFLFTFVKTKEDTLAYVIFGLISSVGSGICNIIHARRFIDFKSPCKLELKKHWIFIFTFFGMTVVTSIYTMLDSTMIGFIKDDLQVGYYSAAAKINKLVTSLLGATFGILLPRMAYYIKNAEQKKFIELTQKSLNIMITLSIPMVFGLIALAEPLVIIFSGSNYLPAVTSMKVMAPIIFTISMSTLTGIQILPAIGKEKITLLSCVFGAIINITLNSIFITKYGYMGAAIGTVAAEFIVTTIQVTYLKKIVFNKSTVISFSQSLLGSVLMFNAVMFSQKIISSLILKTVVGFFTGILIYFLVLLVCKNTSLLFILRKMKNILHIK